MNIPELAPNEPLSPESVLVLPPELRARAIAALGPPSWPAPRPRAPEMPAPVVVEAPELSLGVVLAGRLMQFVLIFLAVTAVTLAMSVVAHAIR